MRYQHLLFALGLFAATATQAATLPQNGKFLPISFDTLSEVQGVFQLTNGHRITVSEWKGRLYAVLNKNDEREIFLTGENTFSTRDGAVVLRFQLDASGNRVELSSVETNVDRSRSLARVFEAAPRDQEVPASQS